MARMSRERDRAARVRRALKACPDLDATRIRVVIEDNVVHLRGAVRAHSARVLARALACDVDGVSRVVDELVVAPVATGWRRSDDAIARSVRWALAREPSAAADVGVAVQQHVVTLTGTVPDRPTLQRLRHRVERIRGVHFVHNQLRVRGESS